MFEACVKLKTTAMQSYADAGFAAAKAGKPASALDAEVDWRMFRARSAWLMGWESGGGDTRRGVVVTERERLTEQRARAAMEIERIDARLADIGERERQEKANG